jgi:uncharacterized membrane protein YhhN
MTARAVYWLALLAGGSFGISAGFDLAPAAAIAWKGAGVGLLALWASLQGRTPDHRLLVAVLAFGALADMVLEVAFVAGAAIFALGHAIAIVLYRRHRDRTPAKRLLLALPLLALPFLVLPLLPAEWRLPILAYSLFLVAMAASALASRFRLAGAGALMFLVSDLLIFLRMGPGAGLPGLGPAIWLLYFGGQALIALGVVRGLRLDLGLARR